MRGENDRNNGRRAMRNNLVGSRRGFVGGLSTLGLASAWPALADAPSVEGRTTWSESIMVVYLTDDLQQGFSYRICRFPDLGATWVWCHLIAGGRMWAYTDPALA